MASVPSAPPSAFAQSSAQVPVIQPPAHHDVATTLQRGCAANTAPSDATDLAFSSFLTSANETFDSSALPSSALSNVQLAGILGLLPQQPRDDGPCPDAQQVSAPATGQDTTVPERQTIKTEPDASVYGRQPEDGVHGALESQPPSALEPHQSNPYEPEGMPGHGHPGRWPPPSSTPGAAWEYPISSMPHNQQPPQQGPDGQPASAAQGASGGPAPSASAPQPAGHGGHMPVPHASAMAMRGYAYGPYGEPVPYPPHARPPPGAYPHPGMPGPPPGHPAMMAYHPGYPPPHHHLPPRGPYYPQDARYPPGYSPFHPGYPPPPSYYRGYPGIPPHPHPAYMYMPPPYGPHPGMHPGMYPAPQAAGGAPAGQPQPEAHGRENSMSGGSAGTTVGGTGAGAGSDGGSEPAVDAGLVPAEAKDAAGGHGCNGGAEGDDVGLEAVIVLRPGAPEAEDGALLGPDAGAVDGAPCDDDQAATAAAVQQAADPTMDPPPVADGDDTEAAPVAAASGPPPPHVSKMPAHWPPQMLPPPHHAMHGGGPYEWPPHPPHPHAMMPPPGYPPHGYPPPGGWMYPYPHSHPMAAASMHQHHQHQQQHLMHGGGAELGPEDDPSDGGAAPADMHTHQPPRRRPSQGGLGSMGGGGGGPMMVPHNHHVPASAAPGAPQQQGPPQPHSGMPGGMPGALGRRSQGGGSAIHAAQQCVPASMPVPLPVPPRVLSSPEDQALLQRPGSADAEMTHSGSMGQLFAAVGSLGDGQCNVSRRTQRLKKRRSAELLGQTGSTPLGDPFTAAMAAMGRDSSTGSGASGLLPMFLAPGSVGPGRRSSNGSGGGLGGSGGGGVPALASRVSLLPGGRQRSEPGYLIEGPDQGIQGGGCWGPGPGVMSGPVAGLGQLVHQPQHGGSGFMQRHQQAQQEQVGPGQQQQQAVLRRTENASSGGSGRTINLPKRFEDAIITMEYPKGPQPAFVPQRVPGKTVPPHMLPPGFLSGPSAAALPYDQDAAQGPAPEELSLHHPNSLHPHAHQPHPHHGYFPQHQHHQHHHQQHQYADDDPDEMDPDELEEEHGGGGGRHGRHADDSDEDYVVGRGYRGTWGGAGDGGDGGGGKKRKAPAVREEPVQPEKKRKARDPATISKVVLNCVIILRMVNHDVAYEKEIRCALGNNPDTSKALRLLISQGKLVRTGQGGRGNPFCYRCTPLGIATLQRIEEAATPGADPAEGPNKEQRAAAVAV